MNCICSLGMFIGRVCISIIFLLSGIGKFMDPESTSQYMAAKGMVMIPFFLYSAAIIEIIGALSLLLGFKARIGALLLILFLIPVTVIMHDFWNVDIASRNLQQILFLKNISILGGLLYVASSGAGNFSLDACCCKKCC